MGFTTQFTRKLSTVIGQNVLMLSVVKKQRTENLSYTISKNPKKYQGGDFILEGKVRQKKKLAS